ncbi:MAG: hypothetical protein P4L85_14070 [Paludisphaera borealis]|nr:hypothetical protein [Paludisphaera borealis]MDR3620473.1 hypothetical protein [Paludisphaera borealis]
MPNLFEEAGTLWQDIVAGLQSAVALGPDIDIPIMPDMEITAPSMPDPEL